MAQSSGLVNFTQGSQWPLCYGRVAASGEALLDHQLADGSFIKIFGLGEGPWTGIEYLNINGGIFEFRPQDLITDNFSQYLGLTTSGTPSSGTAQNAYITLHFHPGIDAALGSGLSPVSTGGDQAVDALWSLLPAIATPTTFSRRAYVMAQYLPPASDTSTDLNILFHFATMKCRTATSSPELDFTQNPAWHILDVILRRAIKPEFLVGAGLTALESNCIDAESFIIASEYCDQLLANGQPRFQGNYAFTGNTQLASVLETMLLNCRGWIRETGGVISLFVDKPRSSVFTLNSKHTFAGFVNANEDQIWANANVYVPTFRDLNIPGVARVASANLVSSTNSSTITFVDPHPLGVGDFIYATGIVTAGAPGGLTFSAGITAITTYTITITTAFLTPATGTGGVVGLYRSLFAQRTPTGVRHIGHQKAVSTKVLGESRVPKPVSVTYDFGNCTFDQCNRILKYERDRDLGIDSPPWKAPIRIQVQALLDSVDAAGNKLIDAQTGDLIQLDDTASYEFAGLYELLERTVYPPSLQTSTSGQTAGIPESSSSSGTSTQLDQNGGSLLLVLQTRVPDSSFYDTSDPDDAEWAPIPGQGQFPAAGPGNSTYEIASATITVTPSGSLFTVTATGVEIQVVGAIYPAIYIDTTFANMAPTTTFAIYVDDPILRGNRSLEITDDFSILTNVPGRMFVGTATTPVVGGSGGGGGRGGNPGWCFELGTLVHTENGIVPNTVLYNWWASKSSLKLFSRDGLERIEDLAWRVVESHVEIEVERCGVFRCSPPTTFEEEASGRHLHARDLVAGMRVNTLDGFRAVLRCRIVDRKITVLQVALSGPSHEYLVGTTGIWTHNVSKD